MPDINLYPTIGLHSEGEKVEVNLGQNPFMYNIKLEMILNEAHEKDKVKNRGQFSSTLNELRINNKIVYKMWIKNSI